MLDSGTDDDGKLLVLVLRQKLKGWWRSSAALRGFHIWLRLLACANADHHGMEDRDDKWQGICRCHWPLASSLPFNPPLTPLYPPQDDIRVSPPGCSGCCLKCRAWVGSRCKKIFRSRFSRFFSWVWERGGAVLLLFVGYGSARTMVGLLLGSCNVGQSGRLFMTNFLVMPACTCNLGLFSFEEDNMLAWELEKCF